MRWKVASAPRGWHPRRYTHLWTSADGETHLKECRMKGFDLKSFAGPTPPQFVKEGAKPTKVRSPLCASAVEASAPRACVPPAE